MSNQLAGDAMAGSGTESSAGRGRRGWGVWPVIGLGLAYGALAWGLGDRSGASALWWLDPLLLVGFAAGWWARAGQPGWWPRLRVPGAAAAVLFIGGSWLAGMLYELSLRTGTTGFGGLHPETATSFLLAQGYYLPFAVGGWWLARRYAYSASDVFWTGALASLYEVLTAGLSGIAAAPNLWLVAPLMLGYYLYVYALILALPLIFLDERSLWAAAPRPLRTWGKVWRGILFGLLVWVVYVGWAGLVGG